MNPKNLIRSLTSFPAKAVFINGKEYLVHIDGQGNIPVLSVGIGSHMQMTLSDNLKKIITLYSCDLYWIEAKKIESAESLSMKDLVNDLLNLIEQLELNNLVLIGFSCYGILALELAKVLKKKIKGVILVSTPPMWNDTVIKYAKAYFDETASEDRKKNDIERKKHFEKTKKPTESIVSVNAYEADAARYWKNFNISRHFLDLLWEGIQADDAIMNHFFSSLLPKHTLEKNITEISAPVILLAGQLDFDSVPLKLWQSFPKPQNFTIIDCGETGHWPNLENPKLFDDALSSWLSATIGSTG